MGRINVKYDDELDVLDLATKFLDDASLHEPYLELASMLSLDTLLLRLLNFARVVRIGSQEMKSPKVSNCTNKATPLTWIVLLASQFTDVSSKIVPICVLLGAVASAEGLLSTQERLGVGGNQGTEGCHPIRTDGSRCGSHPAGDRYEWHGVCKTQRGVCNGGCASLDHPHPTLKKLQNDKP
eukprot:3063722-Amphidinium_carterae.1